MPDDLTQNLSEILKKAARVSDTAASFSADVLDEKRTLNDFDEETLARLNLFSPSDPDIKALMQYWRDVLRTEAYPAFMQDQRGEVNIDPDKLELVIFDRKANASRFGNSDVIGVNIQSLLKALDYGKDGVIALMGHELLHRAWDWAANNKLQEGMAEYRAVATTHRAGYAPETMLKNWAYNAPSDLNDRISGYRDEHLSSHLAQRLIQVAISRLRAEVGELKTETTPLPDNIQKITQSVAKKYQDESIRPATKLELITNRIKKLQPHERDSEDKTVLVIRDIAKTLRKVSDISPAEIRDICLFLSRAKLDFLNPAHDDAMVDLLNTLTEPGAAERLKLHDRDIAQLYTKAFDTQFFGRSLPPNTNLAKLIQAYNSFSQAQSYEEALSAAEEVHKLEKAVSPYSRPYSRDKNALLVLYGHQGMRIMGFPSRLNRSQWQMLFEGNPSKPFSGELEASIPVPWAKHIEWSRQEISQTGEHRIARIGHRFTKNDSAFDTGQRYDSWGISDIDEVVKLPHGYQDSSLKWRDFVRDSQGHITGLGIASPSKCHDYIFNNKPTAEEAQQREAVLLENRLDYELRLIKDTDWSQLRSNPSEFVKRYQKVLVPHVGIKDFSHPFAQRFVDEILSIKAQGSPSRNFDDFLKTFLSARHKKNETTLLDIINGANGKSGRNASRNTVRLQSGTYDSTVINFSLGVSKDHPFYQLPGIFGKRRFKRIIEHLETTQSSFEPVDVRHRFSLDEIEVPSFLKAPDCYLQQSIAAIIAQIDKATPHENFKTELYKNLLIAEKLKQGFAWESLQDVRNTVDIYASAYRFLTHVHVTDNETALRQAVEEYSKKYLIGAFPPQEDFEQPTENAKQENFNGIRRKIIYLKYFDYNSSFLGLSQVRDQVVDSIIDDISHITYSLHAQQSLITFLLSGEKQNKHDEYGWIRNERTNIKNDRQLERLADIYVEALVKQLERQYGRNGLDYGDPDYQKSVEKMVGGICEDFKKQPNALYLILNNFANKAELQKALALKIEDQVQRAANTELEGVMVFGAGGEASIDYLNKNRRLKNAFLKFLKNEKSSQNALEVFDIAHEDRNSIIKFISKMGNLNDQEKSSLHYKASFSKLQTTAVDILLSLHDGYWAQPLPVRGIAMDLLLFPADEDLSERAFKYKKHDILGQIFPNVSIAGMPSAHDSARIKKICRLFVEAFLNNSERDDQRLLLSSLYVAQQPGSSSELSLGRVLDEVLSFLKPAGDKMKQAISNHPATPDYINNDLEGAKIEAGNAPRSDLIRNLERALGKTLEEAGIERVGKKLGEGAMTATMKLTWTDGRETASSPLKPDIRTRGAYRFQQLRATVEEVLTHWGTKDLAPVLTMIEQAERSFYTEVDMDLAERQAGIASNLYDGKKMQVDGKTVHFSAATWCGHDKDIKHAAVVDGKHFLELPSDTPQKWANKATVAKAILSLELQIILSGGQFDNDRHDGQQKIVFEGDDIYVRNFDFGGIIINEPTESQKDALANVLLETIRKVMNGSDFIQSFNREVSSYKGGAENQEYLAAVNRGLLALGKYTKFMSQEELTGLFLTILQNRDGTLDIPRRMSHHAPTTSLAIKCLGPTLLSPSVKTAQHYVGALSGYASEANEKIIDSYKSLCETIAGLKTSLSKKYKKLTAEFPISLLHGLRAPKINRHYRAVFSGAEDAEPIARPQNRRENTIHDLIRNGKPYGLQMKADHHNFFSCSILDRNNNRLAEIALFNGIQTSDILNNQGNLQESAKNNLLVQTARNLVNEAFDSEKHPSVPRDIQKTPELVEGIMLLLVRSALSHANFYRQACAKIHEKLRVQKQISNDNARSGELAPSFREKSSADIDEMSFAQETYDFYDHKLMGGNPGAYGLSAYHLTRTIIDPDHEASRFTQRQFPVFFGEINPARQRQMINDGTEGLAFLVSR